MSDMSLQDLVVAAARAQARGDIEEASRLADQAAETVERGPWTPYLAPAPPPVDEWIPSVPEPTVRREQYRRRVPEIDTSWWVDARCLSMGPAMFFPPGENVEDVERACAVCRSCRARETCLEAALAKREDFGIWGGLSTQERRRILQARRSQDG